MVRRALVVAGLVLVAGCSLRDALSGHEDVVARAAGQELTVERVATMIGPAKTVPLRRDVVDRVADMWVDYQLLAQAIASGDSLLDSATVEAASWPAVVQQLVSAYHDSLVKKPVPTAAQIDSAYNGNDYRYVSHILVAVRQDTTDAVKSAKRRLAQGYLDQVRHGANFATLAARVSEDPGSKPAGGNLGFVSRGVMVKPFEDAAFALRPGEMSASLVESAFGYHILWRPALAQVRDSFASRLEMVMSDRADSLFLDSVTNRTAVRVVARAPQYVKVVAGNIRAAKTRSRTLATWRGGELTERQFATWLQAFPAQTISQVGGAPDSILIEFVKSIARNEMLVAAARARHITIGAPQRDSIRLRYRRDLMDILNGMAISTDSLAADTSSRAGNRNVIAARHVDAYFTAITNAPGQRQFFQVPPYLADVLRAKAAWKVNAAGVDRALERARTLRGPETPPGGVQPMSPAPIQRAPGGPPVGPAPRPRPLMQLDGLTAGRLDGWTIRGALTPWLVAAALCLGQAVKPSSGQAQIAQVPQAAPHELIDRIIAIVGDQPILLSELNDRINQARSSGMQVPDDTVALLALQRQVLGAMIDDEVLYQQSRRDTAITVTDAEVQGAVDQQYRQVRGQFHTEPEFLAALRGAGWGSNDEYRRYLSEQSRRSAYAERFVQKMRSEGKMRAGTVSEVEMREFFDNATRGGQLDSLPPTITFRQIVISPKPSDSSRAVAQRLADSVRIAIEHGADFATMARRFSDDAGSKENGGDLGFFRRGTMVRQFEETAFQLRPGVVSPVVRTEYGYHIIMVDRVQTAEIKARHILITPRVTGVEQAAARRLADSVVAMVRAGANLDSLARLYGDSSEPRGVGPTNHDSLPAGYLQAMATVTDSMVVGPAPLPQEPAERTRWLVARVLEVKPRRMPTFEDVREQVRLRLIEQKGYRNLLEDLKKKTYVDIRL